MLLYHAKGNTVVVGIELVVLLPAVGTLLGLVVHDNVAAVGTLLGLVVGDNVAAEGTLLGLVVGDDVAAVGTLLGLVVGMVDYMAAVHILVAVVHKLVVIEEGHVDTVEGQLKHTVII